MDPRELRENVDLEGSPVKGKALRSRLRNFRPDTESAVRALGGPLAWMRRLRAIEDALDQHERQLDAAYRQLGEEVEDPAEFARLWRETAERWDFSEVNRFVEKHNRYFPVEARLPMDPRTRDFVRVDGRRYEWEPLDADWVLRHWPANRSEALRVDV
ncbi:MAG: hypothetical protein ACRDNM_12075, partial [Gaiellaceae bacterium]